MKRLSEILKQIPSIKNVVIVSYPGNKFLKNSKKFKKQKLFKWTECINKNSQEIKFKMYDFENELAILYSSGTTGKPKCICHRTGGVLIQHKKEHQLHCDIKEGDNVFYFTTCGWMMWNWLIGGLATGSSIFLFDGAPVYPKKDILLTYCQNKKLIYLVLALSILII